jgi:hypothetical protein
MSFQSFLFNASPSFPTFNTMSLHRSSNNLMVFVSHSGQMLRPLKPTKNGSHVNRFSSSFTTIIRRYSQRCEMNPT